MDDAAARGTVAVTADPAAICAAESVDVVIEATGEVEFGASVVLDALGSRKHVVLVNAELDATVGPMLKRKADDAGVVFTNTDGDEPGVTMNLLRYVRTIGLEPVLVGNIKGFIDPHRNPDTQQAFADSVGQRAEDDHVVRRRDEALDGGDDRRERGGAARRPARHARKRLRPRT